MGYLDKTEITAKETDRVRTHNAILNELDDILLELDREIAAYGEARSLSLAVLKDLLEEDRASWLGHGVK